MEDDDPFDGFDLDDALAVDLLMGWDGATCATCGAALSGDPDDDPTGDARQPICGECNRARIVREPASDAAGS